MQNQKLKDIRIWSAGCSSGEEPYTLAILAHSYSEKHQWKMKTRILATDISKSVLEKAAEGIYEKENISKLPAGLRKKYFRVLPNDKLVVEPEIKQMVLFRRLNLIRPDFPFHSKFHVIYCRNVMIYFDESTRRQLVNRFCRYLVPNGYLFVGHSENIDRSFKELRRIKAAVYQKTD
jgi:chemotaxis protein methyltransferase CheR